MQTLQPDGWPKPKGFAHGTAAEGRTVFVAGQIAFERDSVVAVTERNPTTTRSRGGAFEEAWAAGQFPRVTCRPLENDRPWLALASTTKSWW